jgi:hypothetical protein
MSKEKRYTLLIQIIEIDEFGDPVTEYDSAGMDLATNSLGRAERLQDNAIRDITGYMECDDTTSPRYPEDEE